MNNLSQNIAIIKTNIETATKSAHRSPDSVTLIAVSKTHTAATIQAAANLGLTNFAESYVQDALPKIKALNNLNLTWHYIGRLQSNKAKEIAVNFSWVQTVASLKLADLLNKYRPLHLPPLNVCIQVNINNEVSKAGVTCEEILRLATQIVQLPNLKLRGLMAIPENAAEFNVQLTIFQQLYKEFKQLQDNGFMVDTLSMGMSHDYRAAIMAGATMVRIGTAFFGSRN